MLTTISIDPSVKDIFFLIDSIDNIDHKILVKLTAINLSDKNQKKQYIQIKIKLYTYTYMYTNTVCISRHINIHKHIRIPIPIHACIHTYTLGYIDFDLF
jgi:hypothetical protein